MFDDPLRSKIEGKKVPHTGTENGHGTGKDPKNTICPYDVGAIHTISRYICNNDTRDSLLDMIVCRNGPSFHGRKAAKETNWSGTTTDSLYVVESIPRDASKHLKVLATALYLLVSVTHRYDCNSIDE